MAEQDGVRVGPVARVYRAPVGTVPDGDPATDPAWTAVGTMQVGPDTWMEGLPAGSPWADQGGNVMDDMRTLGEYFAGRRSTPTAVSFDVEMTRAGIHWFVQTAGLKAPHWKGPWLAACLDLAWLNRVR